MAKDFGAVLDVTLVLLGAAWTHFGVPRGSFWVPLGHLGVPWSHFGDVDVDCGGVPRSKVAFLGSC